jgi:hypothetical protein
MVQRPVASGTSATRCLEANVIHAVQTAIWTTNAATTIQMSGILVAAGSVLFAMLIFLLFLFVPEPRIRPQKLDLTLQVKMPADIRDLYDRAIKQKGEEGMAPLDGDSCGGCYHQITGNMHSELLVGKVVMCRSCGRLLYLPERTSSG